MLSCLISLLESARTAISDWSDYHQQGLPVNSAELGRRTGWTTGETVWMCFVAALAPGMTTTTGMDKRKVAEERESRALSAGEEKCVALEFSNSVNWELFDQTKGDCRNGIKWTQMVLVFNEKNRLNISFSWHFASLLRFQSSQQVLWISKHNKPTRLDKTRWLAR